MFIIFKKQKTVSKNKSRTSSDVFRVVKNCYKNQFKKQKPNKSYISILQQVSTCLSCQVCQVHMTEGGDG